MKRVHGYLKTFTFRQTEKLALPFVTSLGFIERNFLNDNFLSSRVNKKVKYHCYCCDNETLRGKSWGLNNLIITWQPLMQAEHQSELRLMRTD